MALQTDVRSFYRFYGQSRDIAVRKKQSSFGFEDELLVEFMIFLTTDDVICGRKTPPQYKSN